MVSRQAEHLKAGPGRDPFPAHFLGGIARLLDGDIPGAVPRLRQALTGADRAEDPRRLFWAGLAAFVLGDDARTRQFFQREVDQARSDGSVAMVAQALTMLAAAELLQGRAASAQASATEGLALAQATGNRTSPASTWRPWPGSPPHSAPRTKPGHAPPNPTRPS